MGPLMARQLLLLQLGGENTSEEANAPRCENLFFLRCHLEIMEETTVDISLWDKMVIEERRQRAKELGIRICDLETAEALQATIDESKGPLQSTENTSPATENLLESKEKDVEGEEKVGVDHEEEEGSDLGDHVDESHSTTKTPLAQENSDLEALSYKSNEKYEGGAWYRLPQELVDRILIYMGDVDMLGYLLMTSKSTFHPSEAVYKYFCEVIYPRQTLKKTLPVERWRSSWQHMLVHRPRLRTNGFYTLKTVFTKAPCNDAFWEEKRMESIEVKYYRHLRFFENNRVLYSLDILEPREVRPLFAPGLPIGKKVYEGTYKLVRQQVRVEVPLPYCLMLFDLLLLDQNEGGDGKHNVLALVSHRSRAKQGEGMEVCYPVPVFCNFRFHRVWSFQP